MRAHAQRRVIAVGQCVTVPVSVSIVSHVFSRTVVVVDTKHGYVGIGTTDARLCT